MADGGRAELVEGILGLEVEVRLLGIKWVSIARTTSRTAAASFVRKGDQ
jgi:hypothetical protein